MARTPQQRISAEEKAALVKKLSNNAKERWANPEMRAKMSAAQSKGSKEAWSDPQKKAERLRKREERAHELGFKSYGHLVAFTHIHKSAEKCGMTFEEYSALTPLQRKHLRKALGVSNKRTKRLK